MEETPLLSNACPNSVEISMDSFHKNDFDQPYILADISHSTVSQTGLLEQTKTAFVSNYPEVPIIAEPSQINASDQMKEIDNPSPLAVLALTASSSMGFCINNTDHLLKTDKDLKLNITEKSISQEQASSSNQNPVPKIVKKVFKLPNGPAPKGLKKIKKLIAIYHCKICGYLTKSKELMDEHSNKHKAEKEAKAAPKVTPKVAPKVKRKRRTKKEMALKREKKARRLKKKQEAEEKKGEESVKKEKVKKEKTEGEPKKKRGRKPKKEEIPVIDGKVHCPECSFFTTNLQSLKVHRLMHLKERPYKCTVCDFHGKDLKELIKHHDGGHVPGVFVCKDCGFLTSDRTRFDKHRESHTGHLPYKCIACPYKTMLKAAHKAHMETHGIHI